MRSDLFFVRSNLVYMAFPFTKVGEKAMGTRLRSPLSRFVIHFFSSFSFVDKDPFVRYLLCFLAFSVRWFIRSLVLLFFHSTSLSIYLSAGLSVCLSVCLPVCLSVSLSVRLLSVLVRSFVHLFHPYYNHSRSLRNHSKALRSQEFCTEEQLAYFLWCYGSGFVLI